MNKPFRFLAWFNALVLCLFAAVSPGRAQVTIFSETFDPLSGAAAHLGWTSGDAATNSSVAVTSSAGVSGSAAMKVTANCPTFGNGYSTVGAQYVVYPTANTSANPADYTLSFDAATTGGNFGVELQVWSALYFGGSQVADVSSPNTFSPGTNFVHYSFNLGNFSGTDSGVGPGGKTWQFNFAFNGTGSSPYTNYFYLDNIVMTMATNTSTVSNGPVTILVNAQSNRLAISPMIYGVAFADSNQLADLNFTLNRSGGNNETRYNWQINAHNLDNDYYFESYPESDPTPGGAADSFVANSKNGGAQPMITIPMIGWTPILGAGRKILPSFSVTNYGPQTSVDPYLTNAGNGIGTNSVTHTTFFITNNPTDANTPVGVAFQQTYVQHLISKWGASTNGGVKYYFMDNEHALWNSTHRDVHPVGTFMNEIYTNIVAYAGMVKSNDASAIVLGPEEWGWPGYLYSGYDWQWAGLHNDYNSAHFPDRQTNAGMDYIPWLLGKLQTYQNSNSIRLLDYLTVHCYPQEGSVSTSDASSTTALLRNQSTRVFWDPAYLDPSWINNIIMLIPRMKGWVAGYYPGTKIGVTEYNWGAEQNINGATAQADILGIFGREGLDLATRWTTPDASTPTYLAMKMYRNYDNNKSTFGDTSVSTVASNVDLVSAFGALRSSDGALTLMVINKQLTNPAPLNLIVSNFLASGTIQAWQLTSANSITHLANSSLANGAITNIVPAQSVTLFVLPPGTPPPAPLLSVCSGSTTNSFIVGLIGAAGQRYVVQTSSDLHNWTPLFTNTLVTSSNAFNFSSSDSSRYFRAYWWP